jgi:hypothetical protein
MPHKNLYPSRSLRVRASLYALIILAAVVSLPPAFARLNVLAQEDDGATAGKGGVLPYAEFIRQLSLPTNDFIYNPADKMLYASVPSSAGAAGNSIVSVNPATGETGTPVFIGSEPGRLAMSDDGHTLYVALDGSHVVRRFDTATRASGQQFSLGQHSVLGTYTATDIAVAPGNPNLLAVARSSVDSNTPGGGGVAIYDNGVARSKTGPIWSSGAHSLAFSATESKLYGSSSYGGLQTMTVDDSGVAVASTTTFGVSGRIKFANGLIYSSGGQVVNPETDTLLGTFSGVSTNAFAIDTAAGRAYYVTGSNFGSGAVTLRAFDLNTFVPVGSATLSGVTGEPTTLVRWGANGLALRAGPNKLYFVQTSLIPSSEPDPTPTPVITPTATPTPVPVPTFVRQVPLLANDLVYSAQSGQLYASVPSAAGAKGNSVTRLNPETGEIGPSLFVGSEPARLALADDGQTLYVALSGAGAVRKLDVSTHTVGLKFNLGYPDSDGPLLPNYIDVMPGSPGAVAVSTVTPNGFDNGVTIYDEGVARTQSSGFGGPVEFGLPTRLYAGNASLQKFDVGPNGLTHVGSLNTASYGQRMQFVGGLLYLSNGIVIDPESGDRKGRFSGLEFDNVMLIDAAKNRAFFLSNNFNTGWNLRSYELDTFRPVASVRIEGIFSGTGSLSSLVRWGANGLAFRSYDRIFLIQSALVDASATIPAATPTPSPTPSPTPVHVPTIIRKVDLPANDLVIDAATQTLYASIPSTAGGDKGNTVTSLDPKTGLVGSSTFIGSEPDKLAISDDGQVLYVNLNGAKAVRRFDTATKTPGVQFSIGVDRPADMEVVPGNPQSLVVSRGASFDFGGVAVYDNGVQRPDTTSEGGIFSSYIGPIEFGASPSKLYGFNNSTGSVMTKLELDASGVKTLGVLHNLLSGYHSGFEFAGGRLYSGSGGVVDPEAETLVGKFNSSGAILVDQTLGRVFFISNETSFSDSGLVLTAYDINTFLPLGSVKLPGIVGTPKGLARWGTNGLAFCTLADSVFSPGSKSRIYLVTSALISDAEAIGSAFQFSAENYITFDGSGNTAVITVTRTGDIAGAATVNYATGGGTATPGSDYTPTSGTLTFAARETTKTFIVPVPPDRLYELRNQETVGLSLSGPTGGATLGSQAIATLTIHDSDSRPSLIPGNLIVSDAGPGTTTAQFVVRLSNGSVETISVSYATADGTAKADSDYVATSGTLTFQPGEVEKSFPLQIKSDAFEEGHEQFSINFSNPVNVELFGRSGFVNITADERQLIQFAAPRFTVSEGEVRATITVTRSGPITAPATVDYRTGDNTADVPCDPTIKRPDGTLYPQGAAFARCDYATTADTLRFAPGDRQKTFTIPLVDDSHVEPLESVGLILSAPTGASLATEFPSLLFITDNDTANQPNPVDGHEFFVRMHYLDFLSREPESEGMAAWTKVLVGCADPFNRDGNNPSRDCDRNLVSSSFFRSVEFELKGYFVYRFYRVAFNRRPSYDEFVTDMRRVTGQTAEEVYGRRRAFGDAWVLRPEFLELHGARTSAGFVDSLLAPYRVTAINTPDPANPDGDILVRLTRDELVAALDAQPARLTKAQVLRAFVQSREVDLAEYNGAFVAMQYYGYLRRAPEQSGYDAWLRVITRGDGFRVMVDGFMNSIEYRLRFGK